MNKAEIAGTKRPFVQVFIKPKPEDREKAKALADERGRQDTKPRPPRARGTGGEQAANAKS
jgi:hypothetical protein